MSDHPTQAVILAGGRGTRLLPLTENLPKPMIRFHDRPFLEYLLGLLREQGFKKILLLLGYMPSVITDYFGNGSRFGLEIEYIISDVDDETGARLRLAEAKVDPIFMFLYCDNYLPFNLDQMWKKFQEVDPLGLVSVYWNDDGYTKSNLKILEDGEVALYDKSREAEGLRGVDIGFMLTKKEVLSLIPAGNVSFERTVYPQLIEQRALFASTTHHRYYSVGDHRRLPLTEEFLARRPAVLIDRDGVLNKKMPRGEYVRSWRDWQWLPDAKEAMQLFNRSGFKIAVITNQAGVARGVMTLNQLEEIHTNMIREAEEAGGRIDAVYFCPHRWDDGCFCRKPAPGMLFEAQRELCLDLTRTPFIGDDDRDGLAADAAGAPWIKVDNSRSLYDVATMMTQNLATATSDHIKRAD